MPLAGGFCALSTGCYKNVGNGVMISCVLTKECEAEERDKTQKERDKDSKMGLGRTQPGHLASVPLRAFISGLAPALCVSSMFFFKTQGSRATRSFHVRLSVSMFWVGFILSAEEPSMLKEAPEKLPHLVQVPVSVCGPGASWRE